MEDKLILLPEGIESIAIDNLETGEVVAEITSDEIYGIGGRYDKGETEYDTERRDRTGNAVQLGKDAELEISGA